MTNSNSDSSDYGYKGNLPTPEPFKEYGTMFKLIRPKLRAVYHIIAPDKDYKPEVSCVACRAVFDLEDLLEGELNEYQCPRCKKTQWEYWKDRPHTEVENDYA